MAVIGEVWIAVRPQMAGFSREVAAATDFAGLDKSASDAGLVAGAGLRSGVVSEAEKAGTELESAGAAGGSRFGRGVGSGVGRLGQLIENTVGIPIAKVGDKFDEAGGKMNSFSALGRTAFLGLGAGVAGFAAVSVDSAVKFQNLTTSLAAQAGISVKAANNIGTAFLGTAGHTVYSAAQMVTAYTGVASQLASVEGHALSSSQALGVMRSASDLAEASGLSLGTATQALATTMQVFHVRATGAAGAANVLYEAGRQTGLGVSQVTSSFMRLHSQLGVVTPPLGQLGGLLVDMANHGETGRAAISGLSQAMSHLLKPASDVQTAIGNQQSSFAALSPHLQRIADAYKSGTLTSAQFSKETHGLTTAQALALSTWKSNYDAIDKARQKLRDLGVTVDDSHGKFVGMAAVIAQLHQKIQGMTEAQKLATLTAAFGAGAAQRMLTIVEAGPAAYAKATSAVTRHNAAADAAAKMNRSLSHEFEIVKVAVEDFAVRIGTFLVPVLQGFLGFLGSHMPLLAAFGSLIGTVLVAAMAKYVAGLVKSGVETAIWAGKQVAAGATFVAAQARQFASSVAAGAAWLAEHAVMAAAYIAENVAMAASATAAFIAENAATLGLVAALAALVAGIVFVATHWHETWEAIKSVALAAWHFIDNDVLHPIMAAFDAVVSWIRDHWELLAAILLAPFAPVILIVGVFRARLLDAFQAVVHGIMNVIDWFRRLPGDVVRALGDMVATVFHIMLTAVTWFDNNVGGPLRSWFTALPGRAVSWLGNMVATAFHVMLSANSWFINNVGQPLYNFFSRLPMTLRNALGNVVGTIFSGLLNVGGWLEANVLEPILHWFEGLPGRIAASIFGGGAGAPGPHGYPAGGRYGMPPHALGGITHGATLGWMGEAGAEALIPLHDLPRMVRGLSRGRPTPTAAPAATPRGDFSANVHIHPGAVVLNIGTNLTAETRLQAEALTTSAIRTLAQEMRAGVAPLRLGL